MSTKRAWIGASILASLAAGCGGGAPPPAVPEPASSALAPEPAASAAPAAKPAKGDATPAASAAPAVDKPAADEKAAPPANEKPAEFQLVTKTAEGRPMVQYTDPKGVTTTLGQHGGVLKVGDFATLRVPDGALREGVNVTFALDPKAKGPASAVGQLYKIAPELKSAGGKFQVVLAVPKGLKSPGFALERTKVDPKSKKTSVEWEKLRPTHVFVGNEPDLAVLELDVLPEAHVTLTSSAP